MLIVGEVGHSHQCIALENPYPPCMALCHRAWCLGGTHRSSKNWAEGTQRLLQSRALVGEHPNFERSQDQAEVGMPFIIT